MSATKKTKAQKRRITKSNPLDKATPAQLRKLKSLQDQRTLLFNDFCHASNTAAQARIDRQGKAVQKQIDDLMVGIYEKNGETYSNVGEWWNSLTKYKHLPKQDLFEAFR